MGGGMAANLLKAGFPLTVYNRTAAKARRWQTQGARSRRDPGGSCKGASIVISMLADDAASRAVWLGNEGALRMPPKARILIESSTVSPAWIAELPDALRSAGGFSRRSCDGEPHAGRGGPALVPCGGTDALEKATPC